jgi:cob(I)alamin adenosyltransferase
MVYLNRITTRSGDDGTTALGDGTRVLKTHLRIVAIGSLDELNAAIGFALASGSPPGDVARELRQVQNDLFDAGAELCVPAETADAARTSRRCGITSDAVSRLEERIAEITAQLAPLNSFVLPGGTPLASGLHVARTVCRRAERDVLSLADREAVSDPLRRYLNRLSDLLFVYARLANDAGRSDVLWRPGGTPASAE